jgi:hypothetical protein
MGLMDEDFVKHPSCIWLPLAIGRWTIAVAFDNYGEITLDYVKLLPLSHPPVRARTEARKNPSAQRATNLMSVLAHVYAVSRQNQTTTTVP